MRHLLIFRRVSASESPDTLVSKATAFNVTVFRATHTSQYSGVPILSHSHLLVHHLLKQLENHKRDRRERDRRPEWLNTFVHQTAALFEPLSGVARVGYQCELTADGWEARLYLGSTEVVGGREDGQSILISFEFDFARLAEGFTRLDEFRWNVCSNTDGSTGSFVTLRGLIDEQLICLKIYSRPPQDAGPAFRLRADGTLEDLVAV